ncbi:MAG: rRNA maturation RNase YbeY [Fimbriimonas sp.]|nr:rRNA maturation RNase YbeY [Fimbriimonas sp.]
MEPPSTRNITVLNETERNVRTATLRRAVAVAFTLNGHSGAKACLLLTTDERIRELNRQFRGLDESTDVLTFPAGEFAGDQLGDVAIAIPYAERQAKARNVSLSEELGFLAIHGALHLIGFDDQTDVDRAEMVRKMNEVALDAGLKPDEEWCSLLHGEVD